MTDLNTDVRYIKGIGEKKAQTLEKLGVFILRDLISYFPRTYEDRSVFRPIEEIVEEETVCIRAMVASEPRLMHIRRGMELVKFRIVDESAGIDVTYFNQNYVKDNVRAGETYNFYGKVSFQNGKRTMANPVYEREGQENGVTGRIVPVYRLTAGISQKVLINAIRQGLNACAGQLPDALPAEISERLQLAPVEFAYENIHFPVDFEALAMARRRLVFEELFILACALGTLRGTRVRERGASINSDGLRNFLDSLPFEPTGAQRRAISDALTDMGAGALMNRLVQGDVGSGKTLVAAACIHQACKKGYQSAFMAPTEILADQHMSTLSGFLEPLGIRVMKLTGSISAREKRAVRESLESGECDLVVGTHAILSSDVSFKNLALVVTDEQHRFGVAQRALLSEKGVRPHVLVMSATPIPRTLALIIYGDLDISIIDELPPGRQKVDTFAVDETFRPRINNFIRKLTGEGRQVFVVCPMIEENEEIPMDLKPVEAHVKDLRAALPELRIECIHGKLKAKDKDNVMSTFLAGEIDVLVSTTVIEVGVDVPNAALMIVENAERFGLSQLHQLRGRVGRGVHKSYCILVSDAKNEDAQARLSIMSKTNDGFKISEEDLRLRGPGDFFGSRQHGLPEMHLASIYDNSDILSLAQAEATALLESDPKLCKLSNAPLKERVDALIEKASGKFS